MKPIQKEPETYKKLTGAPGLTAVSDAAKGQDPHTLAEFEEISSEEAGARRDGEQEPTPGEHGLADCDDIEEAYAMLFESLAVIMRNKQGETKNANTTNEY